MYEIMEYHRHITQLKGFDFERLLGCEEAVALFVHN